MAVASRLRGRAGSSPRPKIRIAAQLDHPLILMLIDPNQGHSGAAAGLFYYVMPYASRAKPSALGYAHARASFIAAGAARPVTLTRVT